MPIGPTERKKDSIIRLTPTQCERLTNIAEKLHCRSGAGPTFGMPSWRVMVAGIADGVLVVRNPSDKSAKAERRERRKQRREKRSQAPAIPGAPDWWKPWYGNAMGQEHAMRVSGITASELVELGLRLEFNPFLQHPEVVVGKPEWPAPFLPSRPHWWWKPDNQSTMPVADAVATSGLTVEQLTAGGLEHDEELGLLCVPDAWKGWVNS